MAIPAWKYGSACPRLLIICHSSVGIIISKGKARVLWAVLTEVIETEDTGILVMLRISEELETLST